MRVPVRSVGIGECPISDYEEAVGKVRGTFYVYRNNGDGGTRDEYLSLTGEWCNKMTQGNGHYCWTRKEAEDLMGRFA